MKRQRLRELIVLDRPKGSRKKGKKNRKHGRNKRKGQDYLRLGKHVKSHIRRIRKHLQVYGRRDKQAVDALARYSSLDVHKKVRVR